MKTNSNNIDIASHVLEQTAVRGGYTHLFKGPANPSTGYVVGNGKLGLKCTNTPEVAYLAHAIEHFKGLGCAGVGSWVDGGILYVDPIIHVSNGIEALMYATLWSELAYWDCNKQQSVTVQLALEDRAC
jgi:hypothetical protein